MFVLIYMKKSINKKQTKKQNNKKKISIKNAEKMIKPVKPKKKLTDYQLAQSQSLDTYVQSQKQPIGIVLFYKEGCYYCDELKPVLLYLAENAKNVFFLVAVSSERTDLTSKYNIQGYPTMYFVKNNQISDQPFDVDRTTQKDALGELLAILVNESNNKKICEYDRFEDTLVEL